MNWTFHQHSVDAISVAPLAFHLPGTTIDNRLSHESVLSSIDAALEILASEPLQNDQQQHHCRRTRKDASEQRCDNEF